MGRSGTLPDSTADKVHDALVSDIYDAAIGEWERLPKLLARAMGGGSAVIWTARGSGCVEAVTYGLPLEASQSYLAYYSRLDPWFRTAHQNGLVLKAVRCVDMMPELRFRQTEFYADFARGIDTVRAIGCEIPFAPGYVGGIGIHRGAAVRLFSRRDTARVQRLIPHLQRALQVRHRLGGIDMVRQRLGILDIFPEGIVVCEGDGRVVFANAATEAIAARGTGFLLGGARLGIAAASADQSRRLLQMIDEVSRGGAGGIMAMAEPDGDRLFVLVAPLPRRIADHFPSRSRSGSLALVSVRSADSSPSVGAAALAQLFDLTPAEAAVALALLAGRSIAAIVAERQVSKNTLRTQLAAILRKTDTANQRDLIRLLSLLPALHAPPETSRSGNSRPSPDTSGAGPAISSRPEL